MRAVSGLHGAPGVAAAWCDRTALIAFGDGAVRVDGGDPVRAHPGGLLCAAGCPSGAGLLSAGDDGGLVRTRPDGRVEALGAWPGQWPETLAVSRQGRLAALVAGRNAFILRGAGMERICDISAPRPISAACFSPDGGRIALLHGGGCDLHDTRTGAPSGRLEGIGAPVSAAWSPDGRFLMAGHAEPGLAGWSLRDGRAFRMAGYPGKPLSMVWARNGRALATSGGPALLLWPVHGRDGPMGQAADVHRPRLGMVTAVDAAGDLAVAGWSDGGVDRVDLASGACAHLAGPPPSGEIEGDPRLSNVRVSALALAPGRNAVAHAGEDGRFGIVPLAGPARARA